MHCVHLVECESSVSSGHTIAQSTPDVQTNMKMSSRARNCIMLTIIHSLYFQSQRESAEALGLSGLPCRLRSESESSRRKGLGCGVRVRSRKVPIHNGISD